MKRIISVFMACLLSCFLVVPAFASVATPSNVTMVRSNEASSSDWDVHEAADRLVNYASIMPLSSVQNPLPSFSNTTSFQDTYIYIRYYDMSGNPKQFKGSLTSSGAFSFSRPSDYASFRDVMVVIGRYGQPDKGTYNFKLKIAPNNAGTDNWTKVYYHYNRVSQNATGLSIGKQITDFIQDGFGGVYVSTVVDVNPSQNLTFTFNADSFLLPASGTWNGDLYISFAVSYPDTEPDIADPFVIPADEATAENTATIAQNTSYLINGMNNVAETLEEIVATISNQLAALWNQMYNIMHKEQIANDDKNTNQITQNATQNAQDIIDNADENTDEVTSAIEDHGNFIINGLKSLFIPSDEYFKEYFDDLYEWFSDRFGFLSFPLDLLVELVDLFANSSEVDCILTLPSFSISGYELWEDMSFNLTDFLEEYFAFLLVAIRTVTSIYLIMSFVHLCERKYDEVMMN